MLISLGPIYKRILDFYLTSIFITFCKSKLRTPDVHLFTALS